jgi:hypothetical protein
MPHSGLQLPRKPLRFKGAITSRFAKIGNNISAKGPPTNLGIGSSNPKQLYDTLLQSDNSIPRYGRGTSPMS